MVRSPKQIALAHLAIEPHRRAPFDSGGSPRGSRPRRNVLRS
jgi:hypothetical protein